MDDDDLAFQFGIASRLRLHYSSSLTFSTGPPRNRLLPHCPAINPDFDLWGHREALARSASAKSGIPFSNTLEPSLTTFWGGKKSLLNPKTRMIYRERQVWFGNKWKSERKRERAPRAADCWRSSHAKTPKKESMLIEFAVKASSGSGWKRS